MRVLVIAAHPDDETIGAGGTIARHVAEGDDVYWGIVTQGWEPMRSQEDLRLAREQVFEVQRVLGIRDVFFCGFPTVKLNTVPYVELSSALQRIVDQVEPEVVYTTPPSDINLDHRLVYDSTLVATRPLQGNAVRRLMCYEIGATSRYGLPAGAPAFVPNVFVDISDYLELKLEAMSCYKTQIHEFPHPRSLDALRLQAQERGVGVGLQAAECFQLVRLLI